MPNKNSLFWKYIEKNKFLKQIFDSKSKSQYKEVYDEIIDSTYKELNDILFEIREKINPKYKHFNYKLSHFPIVGKIYRFYFRVFNGFKWGRGSVTIIGKVDKKGNCEYPNIPYYRLTKAFKWCM